MRQCTPRNKVHKVTCSVYTSTGNIRQCAVVFHTIPYASSHPHNLRYLHIITNTHSLYVHSLSLLNNTPSQLYTLSYIRPLNYTPTYPPFLPHTHPLTQPLNTQPLNTQLHTHPPRPTHPSHVHKLPPPHSILRPHCLLRCPLLPRLVPLIGLIICGEFVPTHGA